MLKALLVLSVLGVCSGQIPVPKPLNVYVIDVEGGNATLFVTPSHESLLIDTGNAGAAAVRDAGRILDAIKDAGLTVKDISYINAHGTSTKLNDQVETLAIKKVFKDRAKKVPISSTKSMTGHLLGAAGAIELIACVMAIRDNVAPPTLNLDNPSVETPIDLVPHQARKHEINTVLSNSFGFGGTNASLIFRRYAG